MRAALAAFVRSASSQTISGSDPPSSSVSRLVPFDASAMIRSPVLVEPVKAILRTSGCVTSASPVSGPLPVTTFTTPGGRSSSSTNRRVVKGVVSAGVATTGLPLTRGGAGLLQGSGVGEGPGTLAPPPPGGGRSKKPCVPQSQRGGKAALDGFGRP